MFYCGRCWQLTYNWWRLCHSTSNGSAWKDLQGRSTWGITSLPFAEDHLRCQSLTRTLYKWTSSSILSWLLFLGGDSDLVKLQRPRPLWCFRRSLYRSLLQSDWRAALGISVHQGWCIFFCQPDFAISQESVKCSLGCRSACLTLSHHDKAIQALSRWQPLHLWVCIFWLGRRFFYWCSNSAYTYCVGSGFISWELRKQPTVSLSPVWNRSIKRCLTPVKKAYGWVMFCLNSAFSLFSQCLFMLKMKGQKPWPRILNTTTKTNT